MVRADSRFRAVSWTFLQDPRAVETRSHKKRKKPKPLNLSRSGAAWRLRRVYWGDEEPAGSTPAFERSPGIRTEHG